MADLSKALEQKKFDTRLIDFNLQHKIVKPDELQKHLESLPDSSNLADKLTLEDIDDSNGIDRLGNHSFHS